jgi:integrase
LTKAMLEILGKVPMNAERVFAISANAFRLAWDRLRVRAGITDLHFHDLRHEAISRFFEKGLNVPEVALISGHRDPRMLFRYTHPKPHLIAEKLGDWSL